MTQHRLPFGNNWGGRRKGAGRKPKGERALNPRSRRPDFQADQPVHVTLRIAEGLPSLRRPLAFEAVESALAGANAKGLVRVVHYSVQSNHVHLIVEAKDQGALSRGMQALNSLWARALNRLWGRKGSLLAERYFALLIKRPIVLHNTLTYVLNNAVRHGVNLGRGKIDPYSSGRWFRGWAGAWTEGEGWSDPYADAPTFDPEYWLLRVGWKRHGPISLKTSVASLLASARRLAG